MPEFPPFDGFLLATMLFEAVLVGIVLIVLWPLF